MSRKAAEITLDDILTVFSATKPMQRLVSNQQLFEDPKPSDVQVKAHEVAKREFSSGTEYAKKYQEDELNSLHQSRSEPAVPDLPWATLVPSLSSAQMNRSNMDSVTSATLAVEQAPLADLEAENSQQVYSTYFRGVHLHNQELPIADCKDQVVKMVETYPVVVVQGATGCGKTTQVPQYLLDHYASKGQHCNIVVTQPRRIAAISVARRVCQERNWSLGTVVGYQVGMDKQISSDTRLAYVTTGVLLEMLIGKKEMNQFTHIIVDEVHERDQDTDFLLLVVRKFLRSNSRGVKVILMSATIDVTYFADYFSTPFCNKIEPAPIVEIPGKMKVVREYYIGSLSTLGDIPQFESDDPCITAESFVLAHRLIKAFDKIEVDEQKVTNSRFAPLRGAVLVFLPGYEEISTFSNMLADDRTSFRWSLHHLHSTVTQVEQQSVFSAPPKEYRKIILSTNIAESSITVPDIKYVIDFCLTKCLVCDPETKYSCLKMEWASKANCKQRQGRAGRVSEGRLYRMVPQPFYEEVLPEYGIPEMKRCPLELTVLKVKKLNLDEPKAMLGICLDPPDLGDIERAILVLKEVSALTTVVNGSFNPFDGDLTFVGKVMAQLPLDVRISKMIILGFVFDCLEDCIVIAASLSVQSMFSKPFQKLIEAYKSRLAWADGSFSDCLAMLHAYRVWQNMKRQGAFSRRGGLNEKQWATNNFLQFKRLQEIERLVDEIKKRLVPFNIRIEQRPNIKDIDENKHLLILRLVICGAFYPHYFTQEQLDEKDCFRKIATDPLSTVTISGIPQNQGILYDHALRSIFSICSKHMKIHFEETKAAIEFLRKRPKVGILPAVYTAVKMRQLRLPLELSLFRPDDAKEKLERLRRLNAEGDATGNRLKSNRTVVVPAISPIKTVPLPATSQMTINMYCTYVLDCGHFYAHYSDQAYETAEQHMTQAINHNEGRNLKPVSMELKPDMLVLAPFMGAYYRARVEEIRNPDTVMVFFVDYGNTADIRLCDLREIDPETLLDALITPAQAFECQLAELKPSALTCGRGGWTPQAKHAFEQFVANKHLLARVYSVVDNVVRVHLTVQDGHRTINVNEELVRLGFADNCEESFLSKSNHTLRERVESYHQSVLDVPEAQTDKAHVVDTSKLNFGMPQMSLRKARLHGPYSPLEARLVGMTKLSAERGVKVEQTSVNSVLLDPEPQNPHPRMLVACHVSQSSTGDHINLRSTTLMPTIPGLHCLMSLLFAPYAELRTDPPRTEYIGALCGLGFEEKRGLALYPEHDMELSFDMAFDQDDLYMVNRVRMMINLLLRSDPGMSVVNWSGPGLANCQANARRYLLDLMMKKRETVEPRQFARRYQWRQLPTEWRLAPSVDGVIETGDCVLPLHDGVCLEQSLSDLRMLYEKLQDLSMTASNSRSLDQQVVRCPVCDVVALNPYDLLQHLRTTSHQEKEMDVIEQYERRTAGMHQT